MKRIITLIFLLTAIALPAFGQYYSTQYRVPGQNWMELKSDHFRIVYPERYRSEAMRSLSILEAEYGDVQDLIGGSLNQFPVILNPENDRSNGFVTSLNFRSEIELAPIRGKALSPRSGGWLESVLPHELVHALHFSVNPPALTRILGLFSPDMRRSVHGAAPAGFLEGIAVQYESHGTLPHSGRGNYPYFNNQFNALLGTDNEWSMGQLVHISDFTLPFNRHYIGGYQFVNWLQETYGDDTFKEAVRKHYKYPFLGFGITLRSVTGEWPGALYRDFSRDVKAEEQERLSMLENETASSAAEVPFEATCRRMLRPDWLNNETVLFYARSCNRPTGFYEYSTQTGDIQLLREVVLTEDADYSLSADRSSVVYSRYHADAIYDRIFRGDLHRLDTESGRSVRMTKDLRLFSPAYDGRNLYAAHTNANRQVLVQVNPQSGDIMREFPSDSLASVIDISIQPGNPDRLALIGRKNGVQAIWFYQSNTDEVLFSGDPDISFENGSTYDIRWHPDGDRLLFVSDHTGTMNVYEYSDDSSEIVQLTQSLYNAMEPSYSPDGNTIAYVSQVENEQIVHTLQRKDAYDLTLPEQQSSTISEATRQLLNRKLMNRDVLPDQSSWSTSEYRTGLSWLVPRLWTPVIEEEANEYRYGVNLEGVDLMGSRSYSLEVTQYLNRAWYDLTYRHKAFYPGYQLELYNRPFLTSFNIQLEDQVVQRTFLQQSRGAALKIPFRVRLQNNARFTSLLIEPQYFLSQIRFLDPQSTYTAYSGFGTRHSIGLRSVLSYRLRQFTRDVQPNSGWLIFAEARHGLNDSELPVQTNEFRVIANLSDRRGFRGGISTFLAPLQRWNQSLRLTAQTITQTDLPVFDTASLYTESFDFDALGVANNVGIFDTRYTIPITYPDDGGVVLPVYLSNIYLVLFTQTIADLDQPDLIAGSRTVYGAGIRSRFRLSNMAFDVGVSLGWEATRDRFSFQVGSF